MWNSWLRQPLLELGLYDHCPALLQVGAYGWAMAGGLPRCLLFVGAFWAAALPAVDDSALDGTLFLLPVLMAM